MTLDNVCCCKKAIFLFTCTFPDIYLHLCLKKLYASDLKVQFYLYVFAMRYK